MPGSLVCHIARCAAAASMRPSISIAPLDALGETLVLHRPGTSNALSTLPLPTGKNVPSAAVDKRSSPARGSCPPRRPKVARRWTWTRAAAVRGIDRQGTRPDIARCRDASGIRHAGQDFTKPTLESSRSCRQAAHRGRSGRGSFLTKMPQVDRTAPLEPLEHKPHADRQSTHSNRSVSQLRTTRATSVVPVCTPEPLVRRHEALIERNRTESQVPSDILHTVGASHDCGEARLPVPLRSAQGQ